MLMEGERQHATRDLCFASPNLDIFFALLTYILDSVTHYEGRQGTQSETMFASDGMQFWLLVLYILFIRTHRAGTIEICSTSGDVPCRTHPNAPGSPMLNREW